MAISMQRLVQGEAGINAGMALKDGIWGLFATARTADMGRGLLQAREKKKLRLRLPL